MSLEIKGDADWYMHRIQFKFRAIQNMSLKELDEANRDVESKGYYEFRNITFTRKDMAEMLVALKNKKLIQPKRKVKHG